MTAEKRILRSRPLLPGETCEQLRALVGSAMTDLKEVGFASIEGLLGTELVSALRSEALRERMQARAVSRSSGCRYQAHLSGLGQAGLDFLTGGTMTVILDALFHIPLVPEQDASCYTYYEPGDYLGPHTDHPERCLVTVILYLDVIHADAGQDRTGLELHILDDAPSGERRPREILPSKVGVLVLGLGSVNWHERPMLQRGEYLTAITACYSSAGVV